MVLLKNNGSILPLKKGGKLALFGKGIYDYVKGGGGSGDVSCEYIKGLADGLKEKEKEGKVNCRQFHLHNLEAVIKKM